MNHEHKVGYTPGKHHLCNSGKYHTSTWVYFWFSLSFSVFIFLFLASYLPLCRFLKTGASKDLCSFFVGGSLGSPSRSSTYPAFRKKKGRLPLVRVRLWPLWPAFPSQPKRFCAWPVPADPDDSPSKDRLLHLPMKPQIINVGVQIKYSHTRATHSCFFQEAQVLSSSIWSVGNTGVSHRRTHHSSMRTISSSN